MHIEQEQGRQCESLVELGQWADVVVGIVEDEGDKIQNTEYDRREYETNYLALFCGSRVPMQVFEDEPQAKYGGESDKRQRDEDEEVVKCNAKSQRVGFDTRDW